MLEGPSRGAAVNMAWHVADPESFLIKNVGFPPAEPCNNNKSEQNLGPGVTPNVGPHCFVDPTFQDPQCLGWDMTDAAIYTGFMNGRTDKRPG